jgi:C-terminal processing protease CtpA/Prc
MLSLITIHICSTTSDADSSNAVVFTRHLTPGQTKDLVRRDCYVPAGAIGIFMISTKNGPVIHSVKDDGSLSNHVTPGDRIIALDDRDTRSCSAEEVMQMMMTRRNQRRKLTVLSQKKMTQ